MITLAFIQLLLLSAKNKWIHPAAQLILGQLHYPFHPPQLQVLYKVHRVPCPYSITLYEYLYLFYPTLPESLLPIWTESCLLVFISCYCCISIIHYILLSFFQLYNLESLFLDFSVLCLIHTYSTYTLYTIQYSITVPSGTNFCLFVTSFFTLFHLFSSSSIVLFNISLLCY